MKRFFSLLLLATVVASTCCSCSAIVTIAGRNMTARTLKKTSKLTDTLGKEVILVPMCHIGKQERYDEIHVYLDRLKADGYVTFFETALIVPFHVDTISDVTALEIQAIRIKAMDSLKNDTLRRKMRRIIGLYPATIYETYTTKYKRLAKQSLGGLGLSTDRDIWVDYSLYDLMGLYEQEAESVLLSKYDFEIDMTDPKYKVSKAGGAGRRRLFLEHYRNELLERRILKSPHRKIAVVYGAAHTRDIKLTLRSLRGFVLDKKYNAKKAYPAK